MTKLPKQCKLRNMSKLKVDSGKCIGCGLCVSIAGDCFKLNDNGKAEATCEGDQKKDGNAKVMEAIESCPVQAITISK